MILHCTPWISAADAVAALNCLSSGPITEGREFSKAEECFLCTIFPALSLATRDEDVERVVSVSRELLN